MYKQLTILATISIFNYIFKNENNVLFYIDEISIETSALM